MEQQELKMLTPFSLDKFVVQYMRTNTWLHISRDLPGFFSDVVKLDEIDRLVCSCRIPPTNISLARNNKPLPLSVYCADGIVDHQRLISLHRQGVTVILRSIEQWSPAMASFRTEIEQALGFEAQVNVYLTPKEEKSTPPHWDTHDLLVLQVHGVKRWRLFKSNRTLPLEDERFQVDDDYVGEISNEIVLNAGDTLFLPRGVIHEPVAESYSIHVSVGIRAIRWFDVCINALRIHGQTNGSPLRETVLQDFRLESKEAFAVLRSIFSDTELMRRALMRTRDEHQCRRWVDKRGMLAEIINDSIPNQKSCYQRRHGQLVDEDKQETTIQISSSIDSISVPTRMEDAVDRALSGKPFSFKDLPYLTEDEKVAVCVALNELGILQEVDSSTRSE